MNTELISETQWTQATSLSESEKMMYIISKSCGGASRDPSPKRKRMLQFSIWSVLMKMLATCWTKINTGKGTRRSRTTDVNFFA